MNATKFQSPIYSVMLARQDGGWEELFLNRTVKITPPLECLGTGGGGDV